LSANNPARTVAIIGAGQLGYFLCEAAQRLSISTVAVSTEATAPALQIADQAIVAQLDEPGLGDRIAAISDAVTFEIESVSDVLLADLAAQQSQGNIVVNPDPAVLSLLKNKATQKAWLVQQGFPTLPYLTSDHPLEDRAAILEQIQLPLVQKAQQGGYDGYGVQVIEDEAGLEKLWPVPSTFESFITGVRELAVLAVRAVDGDIKVYDPSELEFDAIKNILDAGLAPASISPELCGEAMELGRSVVEKLGGVGVFAIEMFITDDDQLLINEISPRVHNSGHHTMDSCETSQFEQHMRAVAGLPLGSPSQHANSVMQNILYSQEWEHFCTYPPGVVPTSQPGVTFYWYGKREPRDGRKMGHITCINASRTEAEERISLAVTQLQSASNEVN